MKDYNQLIKEYYKNEKYVDIIKEYENFKFEIDDETLCNVIESYIQQRKFKKASSLLNIRMSKLKSDFSKEDPEIVDYLLMLRAAIYDRKKKFLSQIIFLYKKHKWISDKELIELWMNKSINKLNKFLLGGLILVLIAKMGINYGYHNGIVMKWHDLFVNRFFDCYIVFLILLYVLERVFSPKRILRERD